jgi:tetratricopeptide (TPR) repeat protein
MAQSTPDLDLALAQAREKLSQEPQNATAHGQVGSILAALGRHEEARLCLGRSLDINPDDPQMQNNLGATFRATGQNAEALPHFARAVELAPDYADARYNLAVALATLGNYADAIPRYQALLLLAPASPTIQAGLAHALWKAGRTVDAIAMYEKLVATHPQSSVTWSNYGSALVENGRLDDAATAFIRAIELAPHVSANYRLLYDARPDAITSDYLSTVESLLRTDDGEHDNRIDSNFFFGRIYAAQGQHQRSFRHYLDANAQRRKTAEYDEKTTLESFAHIARMFTREFMDARRECSFPSQLPIFIVGMPRSGTTLVEQIIASHPAVFGAGELEIFEQAVKAGLAGGRTVTPGDMEYATCYQLRDVGGRYVEELHALAPSSERVTDKMPANFRYVGLIHSVLPGARIIHTRRNPIDTCISCFTQFFTNLPYSYDLAELGRYYRGYERLMAHWRDTLPHDAILDVQYEDVVDDLETQARRIIAFCGLEWNDACLRFYETQRPVRTASATQVRRPIYRTSVDRGLHYGDLIEPLIDALTR